MLVEILSEPKRNFNSIFKPKNLLLNWVPGGVGARRGQLEILPPGGAAVEPVALVRPWAGAPLGHAGGEGALRVVVALPGYGQ